MTCRAAASLHLQLTKLLQWLGQFNTPGITIVSLLLKVYQLKIGIDEFLALPRNYLARNLLISIYPSGSQVADDNSSSAVPRGQ